MKLFKFRDEEITEEQVKKDVNSTEVEETKTYEIWMNFAENWFTKPDKIYKTLKLGFKGFFERDVDMILQDFEINCEELMEI